MKIYLVEDEKALSQLLKTYLSEAGYEVTTYADGLDAKNRISDRPDIWILDIMLPGMDGYSLIREIKSISPDVPVIFMSARSAELDRVIGLEMGCDDYLPKPFLPRELVLRVNRILKQKKNKYDNISVPLGPYIFDKQTRIIINGDENVPLTVKEFNLLEFFIHNKGKAISRDSIIDIVWGTNYFGSERVIDDTLRRLRKKIPELPIETVYGFGYILKVESDEEKV